MKNYDIEIIHSDRKSVSIKITRELRVIVRAPLRVSDSEVEKFIEKKSAWIDSHLALMKQELDRINAPEHAADSLSGEDIRALADQALKLIPERVAHYAPLVGVSYGTITIRNQKSRWGSCSSKGNLNFNCLLMLTPSDVIDYVVVHELCHRREMNHSPRFWSEVERILPDYTASKKWLKDNENEIMLRAGLR